ncbi:MAG: dihydrodipicolinate synthase family protein [Sumerlaeia bacterium]
MSTPAPAPFPPPVFALLTPMSGENGRPDHGALRDYLAFLEERGVQSVMVCGTTGEFASLQEKERIRLLATTRECFAGTVIYHASDPCMETVREYLDACRELADGVMMLPPYYYAYPCDEGLLAYFRAVLTGYRGPPVILYHFPRHSQAIVSPSLFAQLVEEFPEVAGMKDSGGDLAHAQECMKRGNAIRPVSIYIGSDRMALQSLQIGMSGSVTGAGNPVPEALVELTERFRAGEEADARAAQDRLDDWSAFRKNLPASEIAIAKAGLAARLPGFPTAVRPPLVEASPRIKSLVRDFLSGFADSEEGAA